MEDLFFTLPLLHFASSAPSALLGMAVKLLLERGSCVCGQGGH